jgi:hypothetical protein
MTQLSDFSLQMMTLLQRPEIMIPVITWCMIWKGIALWKCGRHNQLPWFIVLLVVNTLGLLEIIYLIWFQKKKK